MYKQIDNGLEHKFMRLGEDIKVTDGFDIEGYASVFGRTDQGGDMVQAGAYKRSLADMMAKGRSVKMLWQHDPAQPIGIWDEVREDARGLYVKGRLLKDVEKGREAAALIEAGAIDGLSIGYRTVRAQKLRDQKDGKAARLLSELELWEVSLVTFPMLPGARLVTEEKGGDPFDAETMMRELADALTGARKQLARI
ncbi:HK97 family phage prohead protease [Pacificibacter marinus]|uniref:HK97 family phage prohead protease n=1 Tax=Pacificibacter marinus TaxID=658057 RepID=UPI001C0719FE|nr:HK97 family phage prohead protease [Pacificibacter marinus]MBU2869032.1 HK97 family phage prohead protease [Pacificibacter marinus]